MYMYDLFSLVASRGLLLWRSETTFMVDVRAPQVFFLIFAAFCFVRSCQGFYSRRHVNACASPGSTLETGHRILVFRALCDETLHLPHHVILVPLENGRGAAEGGHFLVDVRALADLSSLRLMYDNLPGIGPGGILGCCACPLRRRAWACQCL